MNLLGHIGRGQVDKDLAMLCGPVTGSVGSTIDRINKDLQSPSYMLYTLTTISVWFTDIHSNCQPPLPPLHTHDSYLLLWHMCVRVCVCVGCAVGDMHTSVGRTVYPVYKLQQHVSTHSKGGREGSGAGWASLQLFPLTANKSS